MGKIINFPQESIESIMAEVLKLQPTGVYILFQLPDGTVGHADHNIDDAELVYSLTERIQEVYHG